VFLLNTLLTKIVLRSPEALAKYLLELDKDDAKYNKYLEWKTSDWGEFEEVRDKTALDARCRICIRAHSLSALLYPQQTAEAEQRKMDELGGDDAIDEVVKKEAVKEEAVRKETVKKPIIPAAPPKKVVANNSNDDDKKVTQVKTVAKPVAAAKKAEAAAPIKKK